MSSPEIFVRVEAPEQLFRDKVRITDGGSPTMLYEAKFLRESHRSSDSRHIGPTLTLFMKLPGGVESVVSEVTLTVDNNGKFRILDQDAKVVVPKFAEQVVKETDNGEA